MRMAFGLLGILGALVAMVFIMSRVGGDYTQAVMKADKSASDQAHQFAGLDPSGRPASDTIMVDAERSGGKMKSLVVTGIVAGGVMDQHFGLKKGDSILEIGDYGPVKDMPGTGYAKDMLTEAYARGMHITVVRDEKKLVLPVEEPAPVQTAANTNAPVAPGTPAPAPKPKQSDDPLQRQIDAIKKIPTH